VTISAREMVTNQLF